MFTEGRRDFWATLTPGARPGPTPFTAEAQCSAPAPHTLHLGGAGQRRSAASLSSGLWTNVRDEDHAVGVGIAPPERENLCQDLNSAHKPHCSERRTP